MWTCRTARNPDYAQAHMPPVSHEVMPTTHHAFTPRNLRAVMSAVPHANNHARPHLGSVRMMLCSPVRLHSCTQRKVPHNPTSQQESMRT